jgi:transcriptional regulator with GAF, ATPase, and Fis domain
VPDRDDEVSTLLRPAFRPTAVDEDVAFRVLVVGGPDVGRAHTIDASQPSRVLVGTSPACDLRLTDREISRRHAALEIVQRRLRLVDMGSKNGSFVNGLFVTDASLDGGETVRFGSTQLRVERVAAPGSGVPLPDRTRFGRWLGASSEVRRLFALCDRLAQSNVPLILEGETGTGKEVLAESLHEQGPRAAGPFVVFDCTAVPPSLVESELFGHERGAFTGATTSRKGVFEQAHGGTLLIDEIGDLEMALQPKLLRALERSEIRRVGGDRWIRVDVRVLAATRRNLDREVQSGRFRDDLFHRIAVTRIELPPLRSRRGDVPLLARHFATEIAGRPDALPTDWILRWQDYHWPGNVRELRNAVARQLALGDLAPDEDASHLWPSAATPAEDTAGDFLDSIVARRLPLIASRQRVLDEFESRYVARVLAEHGGNMERAAAASGIARRHFQRIKARSRTPAGAEDGSGLPRDKKDE